jgi:hypothetical protein
MNKPHGNPAKNLTALGSPHAANFSVNPPPQGSYAPADPSVCEAVLASVLQAVRRFLHAEIAEASCTTKNRQMIFVRLRTRKAQNAPEKMKAELRTLWRLDVARTGNAVIKFVDFVGGFEFRFALFKDKGEFVTGLVMVEYLDVQRPAAE